MYDRPETLDIEPPEDLEELVKPELSPGERLLWVAWGMPRAVTQYPNSNRLVVPLFAVGFGIASGLLFATYFGAFGTALFQDRKDRVALLMLGLLSGAIVVLFIITMAASWRTLSRERTRASRRSLYAMTDRRAIIWKPRSGNDAVEVYSHPRGRIKNVHRVEYPDGTGDVILEFPDVAYWGANCFEGVAEVRRVEELVRTLMIVPESEAAR